MATNDLIRRLSKKTGACTIDAGDIPIHVARVDDVGCLLDKFSIVLLDSTALGESCNLNQKLLVAKRNVQVIIRPRGQPFDTILQRISKTANQQHWGMGCSRFGLNPTTKFDAIDNGHYHIAY